MPSHTRPVATLALVVVLVLAGCSGGGGGGMSGVGGGNAASDGAASGGGGGREAVGPAGNAQALQAQRAVIKTGTVQLEVKHFSAASRNLTRATRRQGGYVSASSQTTRSIDGENVTTGSLTLRVPSGNFSALLSRVNATGTVRSSETNETDVTGQLVDLRARLANLRAQRERLRDLYANASDTEATLKVQKRLSSTQSRIERLQGRLKTLRDQVALSTITVELTEPTPEPAVERWYDVGVVGAFLSSVGGVITTLRAVVVALAYLAPYLLVFGVPVAAVGYLAYRRRSQGAMNR